MILFTHGSSSETIWLPTWNYSSNLYIYCIAASPCKSLSGLVVKTPHPQYPGISQLNVLLRIPQDTLHGCLVGEDSFLDVNYNKTNSIIETPYR